MSLDQARNQITFVNLDEKESINDKKESEKSMSFLKDSSISNSSVSLDSSDKSRKEKFR
jgi:hypothetical protein